MRLQAAPTILTEKQRKILQKFSKGSSVSLNLKTRSTIILAAAQGMSHDQIVKKHGISRSAVKKWRKRWSKSSVEILKTEHEKPHKLKSIITSVLSDKARSGKPSTFTTEQVAHIIALSLQTPESVGVPLSHWTPGALARKAIEIGIVESISTRQVGRFLKRNGFETTSMQGVVKFQSQNKES